MKLKLVLFFTLIAGLGLIFAQENGTAVEEANSTTTEVALATAAPTKDQDATPVEEDPPVSDGEEESASATNETTVGIKEADPAPAPVPVTPTPTPAPIRVCGDNDCLFVCGRGKSYPCTSTHICNCGECRMGNCS